MEREGEEEEDEEEEWSAEAEVMGEMGESLPGYSLASAKDLAKDLGKAQDGGKQRLKDRRRARSARGGAREGSSRDMRLRKWGGEVGRRSGAECAWSCGVTELPSFQVWSCC